MTSKAKRSMGARPKKRPANPDPAPQAAPSETHAAAGHPSEDGPASLPPPATAAPARPLDLPETAISRAMYWQPRHLDASPGLRHVPFLFWLMDIARPTRVVQIGLSQAAPFLSLCQAMDKLGIEGACVGIEPTTRTLNASMREEHATLYGDISFIVQEDLDRATRHIQNASIDLLAIGSPLDAEQFRLLKAHWIPLLSESAVVIVHNLEDKEMCSEARQFFHAMQQGRPAIAFAATEAGLDVMLLGNSQPDRLMRLARLSLGDPGFLSVRQVFARLGDGLLNAQRARGAATEIADARAAVRNTEARCQDLHAALEAERIRTRAAIEAESEAVQQHALLQSQLFDLKGRVADAEDPAVRDKEAVQLHETVERLQGELSGSRKARDAAIARAKALEAEKATLRAEVEAAVEKRKDHWKRIEKLTAELSAVQERLGATGKAHEKALAAEADRRKVAERHLAETQAALEVRAQEAKSLTEDLAKSRSDEARKEKTLGEASAARKAAEKRAETLAHDLAGAANRNEELARQLAEAVAARERALSTINPTFPK